MKINEPDISENFGHGWCLEALFHNESKILCNDYLRLRENGGGMYGGGEGGQRRKGYQVLEGTNMYMYVWIVMKSNGIIVAWDSFAGCVYVRHLDFKHHNAEN